MGSFSYSKPPQGWPTGTYRVELFLDDQPTMTVRFRVEKELRRRSSVSLGAERLLAELRWTEEPLPGTRHRGAAGPEKRGSPAGWSSGLESAGFSHSITAAQPRLSGSLRR